MENMNTGRLLDFDKIPNYEQAAHDFAEGSKDLENILLFCFKHRFKTSACCKGHKDDESLPYFSFVYCDTNENLLCAIILNLREKGYNFTFNTLSGFSSYFGIEDLKFDFVNESELFKNIYDIIFCYDHEKDYYSMLPEDLKCFMDMIKAVNKDDHLRDTDVNKFFQIHHAFEDSLYAYGFYTSDSDYTLIGQNVGFIKSDANGYPGFILETSDITRAAKALGKMQSEIKVLSKSSDNLGGRK